ncbi:hypothetical protein AV521_10160 [Streptomyces sp. IMTB 2501]|uniref:DUF1707 SHOCT-like domain-containing protein n=1 Tax=Streptomyces sp. IMTB 2501 TaxID=1776340 RepID=UPI00096CA460|nr:DUF1707 domain-containing protein [Streptomyces sp. IMTB 2501]OLZ72252.1 hypothetical protein AV521_10160 [Streptomyces sp. IMTB 2501]
MAVELPAETSSGLRASHADRDQVVDVLTGAAGDGRITAEELDERVAAALSARTLGELAVLTADLPQEADAAPAKDVVRIEQQYASATREGRWVVPRRLEIVCAWGNVTLDLSDAVITHDTLDIDLDMCGGTLRLLTRPGVVVDADSLAIGHSKTKVRPARDPEAPVVLRVAIGGQLSMGKVEVRPPRRWFGK